MDEPLHEVVTLLLSRMRSHPEEFHTPANGYVGEVNRWGNMLLAVHEHGTDAERQAICSAVRDIMLRRAHEAMLDELLNGPARREQEAQDRAYLQAAKSQAASQLLAAKAQGSSQALSGTFYGPLPNTLPVYDSVPLLGEPTTPAGNTGLVRGLMKGLGL